jgi:uncharacterized protein DUF5681
MSFKSGPYNTRSKKRAQPWKPGQSGNPAGRPIGSRNRFSEDFYAALQQEWELRGADVLEIVRKYRPDVYVMAVASLCREVPPKEISQNEVSDEQLREVIEAYRNSQAERGVQAK